VKRFLFAAAMLLAGSAFAQQRAPEINFTSVPNYPNLPEGMNFGEVPGVAVNSRGHVFVFSRSNSANGPAFGAAAAQLFEFDQNGNFVREIGKGLYAWSEAHSVRIDRNDNIWAIDKGSNMVVRFNPQGRVVWVFGRKQEAADGAEPLGHPDPPLPPVDGNFRQPTDVAWDSQGNTYITDGYINSRVAKFDKNGRFIKSWGSRGTAPGQFNIPHTLAVDAKGLVYVGDRGNNRIQVFDGDGNYKTSFINVGAPSAICITNGPTQYLFASNSNPSTTMDNGEIYKMTLDGKIVGKFGTAGKLLKEFGSVHEMDCRGENELYVGEITNWRVQKLTLRAAK
jgi:DNA-binding beta-propeller fold protein YncE